AERRDVGRTPGLRAGPDRGILPPAEGLAAHDRSGDRTVHVRVAHLDRFAPLGDRGGVEAVDSAGEADGGTVLPPDRLLQRFCGHAPHDGSEVFALVGFRPSLYALLA